jgi:hypothetical protein
VVTAHANKQSEYFHIELPIYDAVYAAGLPCESYIAQRTVMGLRNSRQRMASHLRITKRAGLARRSAVATGFLFQRPDHFHPVALPQLDAHADQ